MCLRCYKVKPDSGFYFCDDLCKICRDKRNKTHYYRSTPRKRKIFTSEQRIQHLKALRAKKRATKINATPAWADNEIMELVYAEAMHRNMEVDHVVPLQGKDVCGLHVYYNTQLLTKSDNSRKGRKWPYSTTTH